MLEGGGDPYGLDGRELVRVLIFGATGMVGRGVLRECLADPGVDRVLVVGRRSAGEMHEKLREVVQPDVTELSSLDEELRGVDACFFCLGVSSVGMTEESYSRVTYDIPLSVARRLVRLNAGMTFIYVTGLGTDSSERGRTMWARVKGRTENALLALPFAAAYMFRPGFILPVHGVESRTGWQRTLYTALMPALIMAKRVFPRLVATTADIGTAMLAVARHGYEKPLLGNGDIDRVARAAVAT